MKFKCGLVGCGTRGKDWAKYVVSKDDLELIACCDLQKDLIDRYKNEYKIPFGTQDYTEFLKYLKDNGAHFVIIVTPHYLHARQTIAAAEMGFHVYCEKPMAISTVECDAMIEACKKNNVLLNIGFQRRYNKHLREAKIILEEKMIGDVFHSNVQGLWFRTEPYFLNSSPVPENVDADWEGWRGHWKTEGGSALINQTIHCLDWYLYLNDALKDVQANAHISMHEFIETEDNVAATVTFKSGALGLIQAGVDYPYDHDEYQFYGTKGTMVLGKWGVRIHGMKLTRDQKKTIKMKLKAQNMKEIMRDFINAFNSGNRAPVPGEEGRKTIELIRAIYLSIMTEKKVKIPFTDDEKHPELPRLGYPCPKK
jgi:predicted dehydrogenase